MSDKVAVSDRGCRVGQYHPKARLTDADVEEIRRLHEEQQFSYAKLSKKYGVSKNTIASICTYRRRVAVPFIWTNKDKKNAKRKNKTKTWATWKVHP